MLLTRNDIKRHWVCDTFYFGLDLFTDKSDLISLIKNPPIKSSILLKIIPKPNC